VTNTPVSLYASIYSSLYQTPVVCLRYFNVFGPRQDPKSEYAARDPQVFVTRSAVRSGSAKSSETGEQTRDFVFVEDVARRMFWLLTRRAAGVSLNIASGQRYS